MDHEWLKSPSKDQIPCRLGQSCLCFAAFFPSLEQFLLFAEVKDKFEKNISNNRSLCKMAPTVQVFALCTVYYYGGNVACISSVYVTYLLLNIYSSILSVVTEF